MRPVISVENAMLRHLTVVSVILGMVVAPLVCAQLHVPPRDCPMKSRCCRMIPAQPSDTIRPDAPRVALMVASPMIVAVVPSLLMEPVDDLAPVREVPTRTIQLRI